MTSYKKFDTSLISVGYPVALRELWQQEKEARKQQLAEIRRHRAEQYKRMRLGHSLENTK